MYHKLYLGVRNLMSLYFGVTVVLDKALISPDLFTSEIYWKTTLHRPFDVIVWSHKQVFLLCISVYIQYTNPHLCTVHTHTVYLQFHSPLHGGAWKYAKRHVKNTEAEHSEWIYVKGLCLWALHHLRYGADFRSFNINSFSLQTVRSDIRCKQMRLLSWEIPSPPLPLLSFAGSLIVLKNEPRPAGLYAGRVSAPLSTLEIHSAHSADDDEEGWGAFRWGEGLREMIYIRCDATVM